MSRVINADGVLEALEVFRTEHGNKHFFLGINTAKEIVENTPTVDAVEVVRCKDCKHNWSRARNHGVMSPRCDFAKFTLKENDYCSYGEREEG